MSWNCQCVETVKPTMTYQCRLRWFSSSGNGSSSGDSNRSVVGYIRGKRRGGRFSSRKTCAVSSCLSFRFFNITIFVILFPFLHGTISPITWPITWWDRLIFLFTFNSVVLKFNRRTKIFLIYSELTIRRNVSKRSSIRRVSLLDSPSTYLSFLVCWHFFFFLSPLVRRTLQSDEQPW